MLHVTDQTRAEIQRWLRAKRRIDNDRDRLILKARADNGSLREIADLFGLSHTEIRRILNQTKGATP